MRLRGGGEWEEWLSGGGAGGEHEDPPRSSACETGVGNLRQDPQRSCHVHVETVGAAASQGHWSIMAAIMALAKPMRWVRPPAAAATTDTHCECGRVPWWRCGVRSSDV